MSIPVKDCNGHSDRAARIFVLWYMKIGSNWDKKTPEERRDAHDEIDELMAQATEAKLRCAGL